MLVVLGISLNLTSFSRIQLYNDCCLEDKKKKKKKKKNGD